MASEAVNRSALRKSLEKVIDRIFAISPGIRLVAIYLSQCILAGGMRRGVESHDPDDAYSIDMRLSKMGEVAQSWQAWFGGLEALALRYEKLNLTFHWVPEGRFLVTETEPGLDSSATMKKIRARPDFNRLAQSIPK